ncbi:DUF2612 domain-containing protein [Pseudomonas stutzeri]|nr:DUF2612 domain-containing protein [Stutzerimonas stutzeri]MCF6805365.1 DUF2612 domain-containing protein [Stutzerimonas stutzeri]
MRDWLQILPKIGQEAIEGPLGQIVNLLDIDNAAGEQLNIIGRIAGIDRPRIRSDALQVFAYNGTIGAQSYDTAPYREPGTELPTILLPDYLYRVLIKAKIMRNNGAATIDDVKDAVDFIFGVQSTVIDAQDMSMATVWLEEGVAANLLVLVQEFDIIPRPQGVKIRKIAKNEYPFAYKGTFSAQPYGVGRYVTPV